MTHLWSRILRDSLPKEICPSFSSDGWKGVPFMYSAAASKLQNEEEEYYTQTIQLDAGGRELCRRILSRFLVNPRDLADRLPIQHCTGKRKLRGISNGRI